MNNGILPSSFRDPSGFVFEREGVLYRQVNPVYRKAYDLLMNSGLYQKFVENCLLVRHNEVDITLSPDGGAYKVISPERIPFVSYPYEWCFSQLKDAALLTLDIQAEALGSGMTLKDCSAFNVQFLNGKPVFIDTLSFEEYVDGEPWVAYRQFCQHFLAPLALMAHRDIRLLQLFRDNIDGIPLDLSSKLLPARTRMNFALLAHIHLHAASQKRFAGKRKYTGAVRVSKLAHRGLIDNLRTAIHRLKWKPAGTEWAEYYNDINYTEESFKHKQAIVVELTDRVKPKTVWDLGANDGLFSRIVSGRAKDVISFDIDPSAVEKNYLAVKRNREKNILPLQMDLSNPSPGLGWNCTERMSLFDRGQADLVLALALIHHLAIGNNLPFDNIARALAGMCKHLLIEFVPKEDSQVTRLLVSRKDIFECYNQQYFESAFAKYFDIERIVQIDKCARCVYLMKRHIS